MSTYCSDMDCPERADHFLDAAYDCFGRDVRVTIDHSSAYIEPDEARALAEALVRCADAVDQINAKEATQ